MKNKWKFAAVAGIMMLVLQGLNAQYTGQVNFSPAEVNIEQVNGWHIASIAECTMETEPGKPYLPVKLLNIALPAGKTVTGIEILVKQQQELAGTYNIMPTQPGQIPGEPEPDFVGPDPGIYSTDAPWPAEFMYYTTSGFRSGVHIAGLLYYPLQYNPVTQKLYLTTHLEYRLIFADQFNNSVKPRRMAEHTLLKLKASIKAFVENPADVDSFLQLERVDQPGETAFIPDEFPNFNGSAVEYVIITNQVLAGGFQEIAYWKTRKGVPAVVRTVEWIYSYYPGADQAEKVRNFIIDAYENWGIQYVLLGGDSDIVPIRYAWFGPYWEIANAIPMGEFIPTDMYFACLDGNWNADGDATYGEANWDRQNDGTFENTFNQNSNIDQVDRQPEVYVGRMPVEDMEELNRWKVKYFEYVKTSQGNENNVLLFSQDEGNVWSWRMDIVGSQFPPTSDITKLYQKSPYNNTNVDVLNAMNASSGTNYHIISGFGHGGPTSFNACVGSLNRTDMDNLINPDRGEILYLNHCSTMGWDYNTVAEHFIDAENGGVSVIGYTRFGFIYSPNKYCQYFIQHAYNTDHVIGHAYNYIKELYFNLNYYDNLDRFEFFSLNMSSEPEMPVWTDSPDPQYPLLVSTPASVYTGEQSIQVQLNNLATGVEAMICLYKENEVYARELVTGTGGTITANITCTPNTTGEILVTVTAKNYIPVEAEIQVTINPGTHLFASGYQMNDSGSGQSNGNNNQLADAGETIELFVSVMNQGLTATSGVSGVLSSASPYITITGSQALYGNVASLGEVANQLPFVFEVSVDCPKNQTAAFTLVLTDGLNNTYTSNFSLPLHAPDPALVQTLLTTVINNDPIIDPGDEVSVTFTIYNPGNGTASGITGETSSSDPMVTAILSATQSFGDIQPFGSQENLNPFVFNVSQDYQGDPIELLLVLTTNFGQEWEIPVVLDYPDVITGLDFIGYNTSIALTWDPVSPEEAAGYNVYRCDTPDGTYVKLNTQIISGFSGYTDYGLAPVTMYYYKVAAVSSTGLAGQLTEPLPAWTTLPYHADWPMTSINTDDFGHRSEGSPAALDVTGDGTMEIFFTSFGSANAIGGIFGFKHDMEELYDIDNNPTTVSGFYKYNNVGSMCIPAIGDINNDGLYEIITTTKSSGIGTDEKRVFVHSAEDTNNDGKPDFLWSKWIGGPDSRGACLADINNDGNLEIIVKSDWSNPFYIISHDGSDYPGWPKDMGKSGFVLPAACDLDDDGFKEIIFGCKEGIYIYRHNGQPFIESNPDGLFFNNLHGSAYDRMDAAPTFIDLTGNGYYDMIWVSGRRTGSSSAQGRVFALDRFGNFINGWGYEDHIINLTFLVSDILYLPSAAVGYVDYNGAKQLVVTIAENGKIYCWDALGNPLDNFPIEVPGLEAKFISPLIADVDEDDEMELIVASNSVNGGIYAFKFDGTPVVGWPLRVRSTSTPFIADIDNDGKNEIIATAEIICHVWKTEGDADKLEWGSYRKDNFNSGIYDNICRSDGPPLVITENTVWTDNIRLSGNLLIDRGAVLTIKGKLEMPTNARIIVDRGAKLVIDGGKVTSVVYCNLPWRGIEVWGNPNLSQIPPTNQGWVQVTNGGIIENAVCGIRTSKTELQNGEFVDVYGYSGGIVLANEAVFRNNRTAVKFLEYGFDKNLSYFQNCDFITDNELLDGLSPEYFINLEGVKNVDIRACTFSNTTYGDVNDPERGGGIFAVNADILVSSSCKYPGTLPIGEPCPEEYFFTSEFNGLYYGVYGLGTGQNRKVNIDQGVFNNNFRGLFISALHNASVTRNTFNVYREQPVQNPESFGFRIEDADGYQIEENHFTGFDDNGVRYGVGLLIENSGSDPNMVYNNHFEDLHLATLAVGMNRNQYNNEGLCYKCNDFVNNNYDIRVSGQRTEGIALHQGANLPGNNKAPAGNVFSSAPVNSNFFNGTVNTITYHRHQGPSGIKLSPYPFHGPLIDSTVANTIYSKAGSCPSNLDGSGSPIEEQKMMAAGQQADSVYNELALLVDKGDTDAMKMEVQSTTEATANDTYDQLVQASPYLSDTVLKTTIVKEDVLTNSMIRDVMVANPQSGKSEDILDMLEAKFDPMPESMMADIYDGKLILGGREMLEAEAAHYSRERYRAFSNLFRLYYADTLDQNAYNNLLAMLAAESDPAARYKLAFLHLDNNELALAGQTLAAIPLAFDLDDNALDIHQAYLDLTDIWLQIMDNPIYFSAPDTGIINDLMALYNAGLGLPSVFARNILLASGLLEYEPIVSLTEPLKRDRFYRRDVSVQEDANPYLKLYPNPTSGTLTLEYKLDEGTKYAGLVFTDMQGISQRSESLSLSGGIKHLSVKDLKPGVYMVSLFLNNKQVAVQRLTIAY